MKRTIIALLAAWILLLLQAGSSFVSAPESGRAMDFSGRLTNLTETLDVTKLSGYEESLADDTNDRTLRLKPDDFVDVMIELEPESIADRFLSRETGYEELADYALSAAGNRMHDNLRGNQQRLLMSLAYDGIAIEQKSSFTLTSNAISAKIRYEDMQRIEMADGVRKVYLESFFEPDKTVAGSMNVDELLASMQPMSYESRFANKVQLTSNGIYNSDAAENRGAGSLIAIVDSGMLIGHDAFSHSPAVRKYANDAYLTKEFMGRLKASESYQLRQKKPITKDVLYVSGKVPYAFDYADKDDSVSSGTSAVRHGTHVAGIAAGNNNNAFTGGAPDAQIAVMKVFGDAVEGASLSNVLSALEDCVLLKVDAINMSLGSDAGFSEGTGYESVFQKIVEAGIALYISAGNAYSAPVRSGLGGSGTTYNPDTGITGSPATLRAALTVANSSKTSADIHASSSWGPAPNLTLKPEISAPGTNIRSATYAGKTAYEQLTGTSMAAPNITGMAVVVRNLLKDKYALQGEELVTATDNILMSTAYIGKDSNRLVTSPRRQGAGVASLTDALKTEAYLVNRQTGRAKIELDHDAEKTGRYDLQFQIVNLSARALSYDVTVDTVTEGVKDGLKNIKLVTQQAHPLAPDWEVTEGASESGGTALRVPANTAIDVTIALALSPKDRAYLDTQFENGMYVEGYVVLKANDEGVDLNMPFLGFYGDWAAADVFDKAHWDTAEHAFAATEVTGQYKVGSSPRNVPLGSYMYATFGKEPAPDPAKVALGYADTSIHAISGFSAGMLRNARKIEGILYDADTGETSGEPLSIGDGVRKSVVVTPYGYYNTFQTGMLFNMNKNYLYNNASYVYHIVPELDYKNRNGEYVSGKSLQIPFTVDCENPVIISAEVDARSQLHVRLFDNHYAQAVQIYYKQEGVFKALETYFKPVEQQEKASITEVRYPLTGRMLDSIRDSDDGCLYIYASDYARNESWYSLRLYGEPSPQETAPDACRAVTGAAHRLPAEELREEADAAVYETVPNGYVLVRYPADHAATTYKVKEGTVRIGKEAFFGAENLRTVELPASLKRIGPDAFQSCTALERILIHAAAAPALETRLGTNGIANGKVRYDNFDTGGDAKALLFLSPGHMDYFQNYIWQTLFDGNGLILTANQMIQETDRLLENLVEENFGKVLELLRSFELIEDGNPVQMERCKKKLQDALQDIDLIRLSNGFLDRLDELTS